MPTAHIEISSALSSQMPGEREDQHDVAEIKGSWSGRNNCRYTGTSTAMKAV